MTQSDSSVLQNYLRDFGLYSLILFVVVMFSINYFVKSFFSRNPKIPTKKAPELKPSEPHFYSNSPIVIAAKPIILPADPIRILLQVQELFLRALCEKKAGEALDYKNRLDSLFFRLTGENLNSKYSPNFIEKKNAVKKGNRSNDL